ncbi:hypothetical protein BLA6993_01641 [Burkholderia lata]|uniref:hypothetical protein n=1 Tax=Burkholderia lata (strain ATCC 17760 / DSM 23089 / LMG 22485 / NCIMB 9086 / R18194 / 383) TaxID=482957 RepID=UPI00145396EA|nr:hypothetical protein [Burkholderia lata]VWB37182.1 hypothetical protein BLA6993_01641 [Burkholderia lata]
MDGNNLKLLIYFTLPIALIAGGMGGLCNEYIKSMRGIPAMAFSLVVTIGPIAAIFAFAASLASSKIPARMKLIFMISFFILIALLVAGLKEYVTKACFR